MHRVSGILLEVETIALILRDLPGGSSMFRLPRDLNYTPGTRLVHDVVPRISFCFKDEQRSTTAARLTSRN